MEDVVYEGRCRTEASRIVDEDQAFSIERHERARAVDMSAYYELAAFIRQKGAFKEGHGGMGG